MQAPKVRPAVRAVRYLLRDICEAKENQELIIGTD